MCLETPGKTITNSDCPVSLSIRECQLRSGPRSLLKRRRVVMRLAVPGFFGLPQTFTDTTGQTRQCWPTIQVAGGAVRIVVPHRSSEPQGDALPEGGVGAASLRSPATRPRTTHHHRSLRDAFSRPVGYCVLRTTSGYFVLRTTVISGRGGDRKSLRRGRCRPPPRSSFAAFPPGRSRDGRVVVLMIRCRRSSEPRCG